MRACIDWYTAAMKNISLGILATLFLLTPGLASAHASISPSQSSPSKYETFSLSVPVERSVPTTGIRIVIPDNVDRVTPVVKPGWKIRIVKVEDKVTEIIWSGGSIPVGQKDFFQFTARTPGEDATLIWKAYQTYQGGEIVAWDDIPHVEEHSDTPTFPYSTTEVRLVTEEPDLSSKLPLTISVIALLLGGAALGRTFLRA